MNCLVNKKCFALYIAHLQQIKGQRILKLVSAKRDTILFKVKIFKEQSVVAYPKAGLIYIGFEIEDKKQNLGVSADWDAESIYAGIKGNKKYKEIKKKDCIKAIEILQAACFTLEVMVEGLQNELKRIIHIL